MSFVDNCLFVLPDFRTRILTKVYKFCSSRSNLILLELLNKVWGLGFEFAYRVFGRCVGIAASGLVSAGVLCSWLVVEIRCHFT